MELQPAIVLCALCFQPIRLEIRNDPRPGQPTSGWVHVNPEDWKHPTVHTAHPGGVA